MLKKYKLVSIVYGGSGAKYAEEINDLILRCSDSYRYPITSKIVMESVLTGDLLSSITGLFTQTEYCLAFLTADDCCLRNGEQVYRLRQNVIFELGMAIYRLGRERCILLSDFDPQDHFIELPSDLKGVDIKCFSPDNREAVFQEVLQKILQLTSGENHGVIPQYDKLLERTEHYVDYDELFTECSLLKSHEDAYLKSVLKYWEQECAGFPHFEEKCIYFLERIGFIPMFGRKKWVSEFLDKIDELTRRYQQQDILYCGKKQISFLQNVTRVVRKFTQIKFDNTQHLAQEYESLRNMLFIEPAEESGVTNPLVLTVYYDYLGLLNLHLYEIKKTPDLLAEAIRCFQLVVDKYADYTDLGLRIWPGFVKYNLARCYLLQYNLTHQEQDVKRIQRYFGEASIIRHEWIKQSNFHQIIRSALSYEYFICKIDEINSKNLLQQENQEEIQQEYQLLQRELETYMLKSEQLERLVFIQNLLTQRQQEGSSEAPVSEDLL